LFGGSKYAKKEEKGGEMKRGKKYFQMKKINYHIFALILIVSFFHLEIACEKSELAELVELKEVIPDIILDIRYATENNFVCEVLYPSARCFLAKDAALALKEVQENLKIQGYRLKVFDGYRPLSVQKRMWEILPDSKYVANPATGSRHNKGYAVDVSLVDINGNDLLMPTEFDDFSEKAQSDYMDLPEEAIKNRQILKEAMEKHGFNQLSSEWWHFDYKGWENKPNLDIPIDSL
jgi:D-alanyl-D-alanine dipeptidase